MAITYNSTSYSVASGWNANVSSVTYSHTIVSGDPLLTVIAHSYHSSGYRTVSSVTFNGVSLTKLTSITSNLESPNYQNSELWYLVAPTVGTYNIVVTYSAQTEYSSSVADSYNGADQTSPIDSYATAQSLTAVTSLSVPTTVVSSNCWLTGWAWSRGGAISAGSGTTIRYSNTGNYTASSDSNGTVGTGSQSLNYTAASGTFPGAITVSIKPSSASPSVNSGFFALM